MENTSECEVELDGDKIYDLGDFHTEKYGDKYLIIKKNKWLVIDSKARLEVFKSLSEKKSLNELFSTFKPEDIISVLTGIEALEFEKEHLVKDKTKGAYLYLTKKCNMSCPHCYMNAGKANENELNTEEIKTILQNLGDLNYTHVTFTGGEIFLRYDLPEILLCSKKAGLKNVLLTNATLINDEILGKIHHCIDEIQISIDGYDESSNAKIRGANNFKKAINALALLAKYKLKTAVAITPNYEEAFKDTGKYELFAKDLLDKYKENLKIKFSLELMDGRDFKADVEKNKKYQSLLKNVVNELYPNEELNNFALNYASGGHINNCGFGELTINSNGDIYLCSLVNKLKAVKNVRDEGFDYEKLEDDLEKIKDKTSSLKISPCKNCSLNYICGGGCRIKHLSDTKSASILNTNEILLRKNCTRESKEYFFKMMVESSEYLYGNS